MSKYRGILTEYEYDRNNRLLQATRIGDEITEITRIFYDPNGNTRLRLHDTLTAATLEDARTLGATLATSMVEEFEFDAFNRLTGFRNGDIISTYSYNSQGLRSSKTVNGNTINHIWDGMHVVMDVGTNADGNAVNAIFRRGLGGQLIDATTTGRHVIYTFDGMGNVVGLINGDRILADYRFDAFGNALEGSVGDGGVHNPFRYRGHGYFDGHSGLHYLRNRFYDPRIGRFITEDPYWNVGNMMDSVAAIHQATNLYVFVTNNPIMWIDPLGLLREPVELRRFAELGGADVTWNQEAQSITVTVPGRDPVVFYTLQTGSPVWFEDGTAMIEASFLRNALGSSMPSRLMYRLNVSQANISTMSASMTDFNREVYDYLTQVMGVHWNDAFAVLYSYRRDLPDTSSTHRGLIDLGYDDGQVAILTMRIQANFHQFCMVRLELSRQREGANQVLKGGTPKGSKDGVWAPLERWRDFPK